MEVPILRIYAWQLLHSTFYLPPMMLLHVLTARVEFGLGIPSLVRMQPRRRDRVVPSMSRVSLLYVLYTFLSSNETDSHNTGKTSKFIDIRELPQSHDN